MDREINLDSIRALEKQIQEHEKALIKLKRARNSLLNVSTLFPPEVLGSIFQWNATPVGNWGAAEGLVQLPPRLPPLVSSCLGHPGTLEFLGEFD
jgi:hypothetical protein